MAEYVFPANDYDRPRNLLALLGSFWSELYTGRDQTLAFIESKTQIEHQSVQDLAELVASISRYTVPIFHKDNWYMLTLRRSEMNMGPAAMTKFDGSIRFDTGRQFDVPPARDGYIFSTPANLSDVRMVMNRFTEPSLTWVKGVDYVLEPGGITFRTNPFQDNRVARRPVYENGEVVDEEAVLWLFRGDFDWETVYQQFGYVLGMRLKSSLGYRELMNAVFDALVGGTTRRQIETAFAAMTGVPLVLEPVEVVERIAMDHNHRLIITDSHVYRFNPDVNVLVEEGQTVYAGDPLTDTLAIYELNRGETPESIRALAMGRGFLSTCFYSDLIFEDKDVPLEVITDDPSGFTKLKFSLGGFPVDVDRFFDEMHERGVAESQLPVDECSAEEVINIPGNECDDIAPTAIRRGTLAHLLDTRTNRVGEPGPSNLPRTINPLQFLIQNVLRNNAAIVQVKLAGLGRDAIGLHNMRYLKRITPPHTALLLVIELTPAADSVRVGQILDSVSLMQAMEPLSDDAGPGLVNESRFRLRHVAGSCQ